MYTFVKRRVLQPLRRCVRTPALIAAGDYAAVAAHRGYVDGLGVPTTLVHTANPCFKEAAPARLVATDRNRADQAGKSATRSRECDAAPPVEYGRAVS